MNTTIAAKKAKPNTRNRHNKLLQKNIITSEKKELKKVIWKFIKQQDHPCLSAQSVVKNNTLKIGKYEALGSVEAAESLGKDLQTFIEYRSSIKTRLASFMAVFDKQKALSEIEFENLLWKQLQLLHNTDKNNWDTQVSNDPKDPEFSFSFGGKAFYIIGMHPHSSRLARQFPYPALVFNLHEQFETLREQGHYYKMRDLIRLRDKNLQGFENSMVADHGSTSEASQYSGRIVDKSWKCPFHNTK
jgi:uncharacterized protein